MQAFLHIEADKFLPTVQMLGGVTPGLTVTLAVGIPPEVTPEIASDPSQANIR